MTQEQEFEFRYRLEQEQQAAKQAEGTSVPAVIEPSAEEMATAQRSLAFENRSMEPVTLPEAVQAYFSPAKKAQIAQEQRTTGIMPPEPEQVIRLGGPLAAGLGAGIATGGLGAVPAFLATMGIGAGAGIASEFGAESLEKATGQREKYNLPAISAAGFLGATPNVRVMSATSLSTGKNVLGLFANAAAQAGVSSGFASGAEFIEKGTVSPKTAAISGGIGLFGGAVNTFADRISKSAAARESARKVFEDAGFTMDEIPIQYMVPQHGRFSDRQIGTYTTLASQQDAAFRQKVLEKAQAGVGELIEGGVLAKDLQQYVDTLDDAQKLFAKQSNEAASATLALQRAEENLAALRAGSNDLAAIGGAEQAVEAAKASLRGTRANDIRKAAAAYAIGQTPEGVTLSPSEAAGLWENRVRRPLDQMLKDEAARRFSPEAIGITPTQGLLTTDDLADAVNTVKSRLNVGDNELGINLAAGLDEGASLTLNEVRAVRKKLMDSLENAPEGNKRADAIALALDAEIANRTRNAIKGVAGEAGLNAYDDANKYYRGVMVAKTNPQGRALLGRQVNDEAVDSMVSKVLGGKYDEYDAALRYIDSIAAGSPEIQRGMKTRLNNLVRDSLVSKHTQGLSDESKILDVDGLLTDIVKIGQNRTRSGAPFKVEELGFGSVAQIKSARDLLKGFAGRSLTESELKQFYGNPAVAQALSSGVGFSEAARKASAEIGVARDTYGSLIQRASGNVKSAELLAQQARAKAKAAGMSLQQTEQLIEAQKADPVLGAMFGGRYFGMSAGEVQPDFTKFMTFMTNPSAGTLQEKTRLLRGLEKSNPQLLERIRSRFLMDKLLMLANPRNPSLRYDINFQAADEIINPVAGADKANMSATIRLILGKETYGQLKKLAPFIAQVAKSERLLQGGKPGAQIARTASVVGGARGIAEGRLQGAVGAGATTQALFDFIDSGRGRLAAFFIQNPQAFFVYKNTGSLMKAIGSIGAQRGALLLANDPEMANIVRSEVAKEKPTP